MSARRRKLYHMVHLRDAERAGYISAVEANGRACPYRRADLVRAWIAGVERAKSEKRK
jgi:hypothetical protein